MTPVQNRGDDYVSGPLNSAAPGPLTPFRLFDYTLPADAPSIDTFLDGPGAGFLSQNFAILEIWIMVRTDEGGAFSPCEIHFNNDFGPNYDYQIIRGQNATTASVTNHALTSLELPAARGDTSRANVPSIHRATIPGYASNTFEKVCEITTGAPDSAGASSIAEAGGGLYRNQAGISRVKINVRTAGKNLRAGSRLLIYGR